MDLSPLKDLGDLPFDSVTAAILYQVLGPTAKYAGGKLSEFAKGHAEKLEQMFLAAYRKMDSAAAEHGSVPARVLRAAIAEGAITEDRVAASYLGGVLASSKSECPRDDRGVAMAATIARLSVYQIRMHYAIYRALHLLFQGQSYMTSIEFHLSRTKVRVGEEGIIQAMGFDSIELSDPGFDQEAVLTHSMHGLEREGLVGESMFNWGREMSCCATSAGIELYLWACGRGRKPTRYFFDRDFDPAISEEPSVQVVLNRSDAVNHDGPDVLHIPGFESYFCDNAYCDLL